MIWGYSFCFEPLRNVWIGPFGVPGKTSTTVLIFIAGNHGHQAGTWKLHDHQSRKKGGVF
jgi:hypothetical protein